MNSKPRNNEVDFIRMAALVGICVVNIPFMALPAESAFIPPDLLPDKVAAFFIECFFQLKFFLLFSFIFGWGIAIQWQSANDKQQNFSKRYFRRMLGLGILGVAHAALVFNGDILFIYAVLGALFWFVKDYSCRGLIKLAFAMIPLSIVFLFILAVLIEAVSTDNTLVSDLSQQVGLGGSFIDATKVRVKDWPATLAFLMLLQGPLIFAAFAIGLAAAKARFFSIDSRGFKILKRWVPYLLVIGVILNALYAAVIGVIVPPSQALLNLSGFVLISIGAPALSFVYLYWFILIARNVSVPKVLILAGRNSLSTYVLQGVIAGFVFGGYGFGLFASIMNVGLLALSLSLLIAAHSMLMVGIYAYIFGQGPL